MKAVPVVLLVLCVVTCTTARRRKLAVHVRKNAPFFTDLVFLISTLFLFAVSV